MLLQSDPVYVVVGVITLEDIIEEILGAEIEDETEHMEDSHFVKSPQFRDMDFARLKLLNNAKSEDQLTADEVRAIVSHLSTNVPALRNLFEGKTQGLTDLIRQSSVMTMKRRANSAGEAALHHVQEDLVYRRGKVASMCTLILSGNMSVLAGKDEFLSQVGPWSLLAVDALLLPEGSYIPDFSAYVASESVRFVSISMSNTSSGNSKQQVLDLLHQATGDGSSALSGHSSGDTSAGRNRSHSRAGSFVGAHSLAERKQSFRRRSTLKDMTVASAAAAAPAEEDKAVKVEEAEVSNAPNDVNKRLMC